MTTPPDAASSSVPTPPPAEPFAAMPSQSERSERSAKPESTKPESTRAATEPKPSRTAERIIDSSARNHWMGAHRIDLDSCGSTNDEAARLARAGARHGTVVTALAQTQGRGRAGRTWASPPGGNLYVSMVLRPALPLRDVPAMTLAIGVALCEVAKSFGAAATLKWPNDILIGGKKVAGILLESQSRADKLDVVIAGIGINLSTTPDAEAAPNATSLTAAVGEPVDREVFLGRLLQTAEHWVDRYVACGLPGVIPAWHSHMDPNVAAQAYVGGELVVGTLQGLDPAGALLLRDPSGVVHRVIAGEVETLRAAAT